MADDGRLVTFAFTPLLADERPVRDATLIPGKPRYEAVEVRTEQFDDADAARAAEQLHADETRSTAAALRRITGQ
jgi:hypothetical protein